MRGFFEFGSPMIRLPVSGKTVGMILDTGFNGSLMLSANLIEELSLKQIGVSDYTSASGSGHVTKVYLGKVLFLDEFVEVPVLSASADFSLAGMELFSKSRIIVEASKGVVEVSKSE